MIIFNKNNKQFHIQSANNYIKVAYNFDNIGKESFFSCCCCYWMVIFKGHFSYRQVLKLPTKCQFQLMVTLAKQSYWFLVTCLFSNDINLIFCAESISLDCPEYSMKLSQEKVGKNNIFLFKFFLSLRLNYFPMLADLKSSFQKLWRILSELFQNFKKSILSCTVNRFSFKEKCFPRCIFTCLLHTVSNIISIRRLS